MARTSPSTYFVVPFIVVTSIVISIVMAISADYPIMLVIGTGVGVLLAFVYWVCDRYDLG